MSFLATSSEGVRRLSLVAGGVGSLLWIVFLFEEGGFNPVEPLQWFLLIGSLVVSPFVGFALVRLVAWVIFGFMRKKD